MASANNDRSPNASKAAAIAAHVVRMMSDYTGRGPTKARTYIDDDLVTVVWQETLTKGERSLVSDDLGDLVLTTRKAYQATMRQDLIDSIETIPGRTVGACTSDNHIDRDMAVEVCVLVPASA